MANRGIGDDGRDRIWGEGRISAGRGFRYRSDQGNGNGASEVFGHDRSPLQRTRSFPVYGNMTRENSLLSTSLSRIWAHRHQQDQSAQSNPRPDQNRATERPQDQGAENTLKLLHDVMTQALSNRSTHTHTPEVSKLLSTMKNIGSYKFNGG
ncbi:Uncharacterized protein Rs2_41031 [Raphanus sativus]|nr:Uncharacterized protein Rs2_41031 [Raphanus sativus]